MSCFSFVTLITLLQNKETRATIATKGMPKSQWRILLVAWPINPQAEWVCLRTSLQEKRVTALKIFGEQWNVVKASQVILYKTKSISWFYPEYLIEFFRQFCLFYPTSPRNETVLIATATANRHDPGESAGTLFSWHVWNGTKAWTTHPLMW